MGANVQTKATIVRLVGRLHAKAGQEFKDLLTLVGDDDDRFDVMVAAMERLFPGATNVIANPGDDDDDEEEEEDDEEEEEEEDDDSSDDTDEGEEEEEEEDEG